MSRVCNETVCAARSYSTTARSRVVLSLYALAVSFCLMALLVATSDSWKLGLSFIGVEFLAVLLIRRAGLSATAGKLARHRLKTLGATAPSEPPLNGSFDPGVEVGDTKDPSPIR